MSLPCHAAIGSRSSQLEGPALSDPAITDVQTGSTIQHTLSLILHLELH